MMFAIHLDPWSPLLAFGIPSVAFVAFLAWKNGRAMMKMDEKIESISHAVNGQPDNIAPMVEKVADIELKVDELLDHDAERDVPGLRYEPDPLQDQDQPPELP